MFLSVEVAVKGKRKSNPLIVTSNISIHISFSNELLSLSISVLVSSIYPASVVPTILKNGGGDGLLTQRATLSGKFIAEIITSNEKQKGVTVRDLIFPEYSYTRPVIIAVLFRPSGAKTREQNKLFWMSLLYLMAANGSPNVD
ncbi:hypothetical protein TNCT_62621 [Trichonephila clavata]|uniref:Uncharacterized protein n=1 Tax=Trichonephila clavata TaxID=2740835 RepID=A0A8X6F3B6_TRICU|nr:hypothetical protein TNCT_62621 [Trichonephila clavata]